MAPRDERLTPEFLAWAYRQGAFPMGDDDGSVEWYRSEDRAVFDLNGMHVSRSLARRMRAGGYRVSFDEAFEAVMRSCRRPSGNWITEPLIALFVAAHVEGWAHSCEVWMGEELVGGVYGLAVGGCFCAESMFHLKTDMSKIALFSLIERCRELGFVLFDAQVMNPHLKSLGAKSLTDWEYMGLLAAALHVQTEWS